MFNPTESHSFFEQVLFLTLGKECTVNSFRFVSGGCINNTLMLDTSAGKFFLKFNQNDQYDMFEKEAHGLQLLRSTGLLEVPEVLGFGKHEDKHFLLLELIDSGRRKPDFFEDFGKKLAEMHRNFTDSKFGLDTDNYIGRLPQSNQQTDNWIDFFINRRLEPQLQLAYYNRIVDAKYLQRFRKIYPKFEELLASEPASLLHGDLWSGNFMIGTNGTACLIDPAVYYGNREIEIAFTRMFGGFDEEFYRSYFNAYPLSKGYEQRFSIYNMYPYLVHVNLFGSSYLSGVNSVLKKYVG